MWHKINKTKRRGSWLPSEHSLLEGGLVNSLTANHNHALLFTPQSRSSRWSKSRFCFVPSPLDLQQITSNIVLPITFSIIIIILFKLIIMTMVWSVSRPFSFPHLVVILSSPSRLFAQYMLLVRNNLSHFIRDS